MFLPLGDNVERRTLPIVPTVLIILNVFAFAYQTRIIVTAPDDTGFQLEYEFIKVWGLVPASLAEGKIVGVLTHMFLHGGVMHILGNMIVLWAFSLSLEEGMGRWYLAGFYLLWGVIGGLTHCIMSWGSEIPLVGASGAIAGAIGAYTVAYGPASKIKAIFFLGFRPIPCTIPASVFGLGWFGMQLWEASNDPGGETGGVAFGAHIGGFVAGAVTMLVMRNFTTKYLVEVGGQLEFRDREQEAEDAATEETAGSAVLAQLPAPCPYCGEVVTENSLMGKLARCHACGGLAFVVGPVNSSPPAEEEQQEQPVTH